MKIISVNCNKRLGNEESLQKMMEWLGGHDPDLVLVPEPWQASSIGKVRLAGFDLLGFSDRLAAWGKTGHNPAQFTVVTDYYNLIEYPDLIISSVYLDPYTKKGRRDQLNNVADHLSSKVGNHLILGDFNLAPRPIDGLTGGKPSKYHGKEDRGALENLMTRYDLTDVLDHEHLGEQHYSIIPPNRTPELLFRVDLCLASTSLAGGGNFTANYDHVTRDIANGFTDHSAIVVEL